MATSATGGECKPLVNVNVRETVWHSPLTPRFKHAGLGWELPQLRTEINAAVKRKRVQARLTGCNSSGFYLTACRFPMYSKRKTGPMNAGYITY